MQFPDSVLTRSKEGKLEIRALESRGSFVICKYLDAGTGENVGTKRKLSLRHEDGRIEEYFIVPLKVSGRSLMLKAEVVKTEKKAWSEALGREVDLW